MGFTLKDNFKNFGIPKRILYLNCMSYQYKKSSILYELEQAIKRKVVDKPKPKEKTPQETCHKNLQASLDRRKNQRQSVERLSKNKETQKAPGVTGKGEKIMSLFNNENLLNVATSDQLKSPEPKRLNHRKLDKLISLINYALSSADKTLRYINTANFEAEFAVKLFRSDRENLLNQIKSLSLEDIIESTREAGSKTATPSLIMLQEENLRLKKELTVLQKEHERTLRKITPSEAEALLIQKELQIEKFKEVIYRLKGSQFADKVTVIIDKEMKYQSMYRKSCQGESSEFDSILKSLASERNCLCKEFHEPRDSRRQATEWLEIKHYIDSKMRLEQNGDQKPLELVKKFYQNNIRNPQGQSKISSRLMADEDKINHIRQEKQELMVQIEECKKKIGEINTVAELKAQVDSIKVQNKKILNEIYKLLPEKLREGLEPEPYCEQQLLGSLREVIEDYMELQEEFQNLIRKAQESEQELFQMKEASTQQKNKEESIKILEESIRQKNKEIQKATYALTTSQRELAFQIQLVLEKEDTLTQIRKEMEKLQQQLNIAQNEVHLLQEKVEKESAKGEGKIKEMLEGRMSILVEQIQEYKSEVQQKEREIVGLQESQQSISSELEQLQNQVTSLQNQLQKAELDKTKQVEEKIQKEQELLNAQLRMEELQAEIKELQADMATLRKESKDNIGVIIEYEEQLEDRDAKIEQFKRKETERQQELAAMQNKYQDVKVRLFELEHKYCPESPQSAKHRQHRYDNMEAKQVELQSREEALERKILSLKKKVQTFELAIQQKEQSLSHDREKLEHKQYELECREKELNEKEDRVQERIQCMKEEFEKWVQEQKHRISEMQLAAESKTNTIAQRESIIQGKQTAISKKQIQLDQKSSLCNIRQKELQENLAKALQKQTLVQQQQQELERRLADLENREKQLQIVEQRLNVELDGTQNELTKQLEGRAIQVSEKLEIIANLQNLLKMKESQMQAMETRKSTQYEKLKAAFQEATEEIQSRNQTIEQSFKNNQNLKEQLEQAHIKLQKQVAELDDQDKENKHKKHRIDTLEQTVIELQKNEQRNIELVEKIQKLQETVQYYKNQGKDLMRELDQYKNCKMEQEEEMELMKQTINGLSQEKEEAIGSQKELEQAKVQLQKSQQNLKQLSKWKNITSMKEKQYCNLIKRILRGCIDLDELGDTDSMNLGTLLELGAQKVMEVRMKIREQESNQKRLNKCKENSEEIGFHLYVDGDESANFKSEVENFEIRGDPYEPEALKIGSVQSQNEKTQRSPKQVDQGDKSEGIKDIDQFAEIQAGVNDSMISADPQDSEKYHGEEPSNSRSSSEKKENKDQQNLKQENASQVENGHKIEANQSQATQITNAQQAKPLAENNQEEVQEKELDEFNDYQSERNNQSMMSENIQQQPHHEQPQQEEPQGVNLSEFRDEVSNGELSASMVSVEQPQKQQAEQSQTETPFTDYQKEQAAQVKHPKENIEQPQPAQNKKEALNQEPSFSAFDHFNDHEVDLSSIQHHEHPEDHHDKSNHSMELDNFLDFQEGNPNQSMLSQSVANANSNSGKDNEGKSEQKGEDMNNLDDFDDIGSSKMSESMLSDHPEHHSPNEKQTQQKALQDENKPSTKLEQKQNIEEPKEEESKNDLADFDDFNSEKMSESMISEHHLPNQKEVQVENGDGDQQVENGDQQKKNASIHDLDDFNDFASQRMSESMLSETQFKDQDLEQVQRNEQDKVEEQVDSRKQQDEADFNDFQEMGSDRLSQSMVSESQGDQ